MTRFEYIHKSYCKLCGDPSDTLVGEDWTCFSCMHVSPAFDSARSAVRYRGAIKDILMSFKYHNAVWLAQDLVLLLMALMSDRWIDLSDIDGVIPVPLHPRKERVRTYNQAELLATGLARAKRINLLRGRLVRLCDKGSQTHLTRQARAANVQGVFGVKKPHLLSGKRLLLLDDVMTTGATANACAKVLKEAGAASVFVATVARG